MLSRTAFAVALLVGAVVQGKEFMDDDDDDKEELDEVTRRAHGFGKDIAWVDWNEALDQAEELDKPVFLLIHKSWCHACQALKKKFEQSSAQKEFKALSEHFVMVNTEDDEEPWEEKYQPDGKYIPRLLFITPEGEFLPDIQNELKEFANYKYYYANPGHIMDAMKKVLLKLGRITKEEAAKKVGGEGKKTNEKVASDSKKYEDAKAKNDAKKDKKDKKDEKKDKKKGPKDKKEL